MKYVLYDPTTGEIDSILNCPEELAEINTPEHLSRMAVSEDESATWRTHHVQDGSLVPYTNEQALRKNQEVSIHHRWSNEQMAYLDLRPLEHVRALKNSEVNAARLAANRSHFTYQGQSIACDELSRSDIEGVNGYVALNAALPDGWVGGWKTTGNTYVPITTVEEWRSFYAAMVMQGQANFVKAQQLKAAINAATSIDELESINW